MPTSDAAPRCDRNMAVPRLTAALLGATALVLAGCIPPEPQKGGTAGSAAPGADTAIKTEKLSAPGATEKSSGPVALAPEIAKGGQGTSPPPAAAVKPAPNNASASALPPLAVAPAPKTAVAPTAPAKPAVATAAATPPPGESKPATACPTGTFGMWSKDVIGSEVYICRPTQATP